MLLDFFSSPDQTMKKFLFFLPVWVCLIQAKAQTIEPCGFDTYRKEWLKSPQNREANEYLEKRIKLYVEKQRSSRRSATVYTLPVVVHIIHNGEVVGTCQNPDDATVATMITALNNYYRNTNSLGIDIELNFQLAVRSGASCNGSTTGINRVNGSGVTNYTANGISYAGGSGASESAVKALSKWSSTEYINIWVVNKINGGITGCPGGGSGTFTAGFSGGPGNPGVTDGVVMVASQVNGTSTVLAHEMGHYFNLLHTFQGDSGGSLCPSNTTCSTQGDLVCDTDPHIRISDISTCPDMTINGCTMTSYQPVVYNYMNYSNCLNRFSAGQKTRMRAVIDGGSYRSCLTSSLALSGTSITSPTTPTSSFSASFGVGTGTALGIERFQFNTIDRGSQSSYGDGANYVDLTCSSASTSVNRGSTYSFSLKAAYINNHYARIYIDYNNDGDFNDTGESVFNSSSSANIISGNITIPTSGVTIVQNTLLRMRVIANWTPILDPNSIVGHSASLGAGQAEDYGVTVLAALPVELVTFKAEEENKKVKVNWQTASERESSHFVIERSKDLYEFEEVANIDAKGTTSQSNNYTWLDENPYLGISYYRLTQIDKDGTPQLYRSVAVLVEDDDKSITVFPNPSEGGTIQVKGENLKQYDFSLLTSIGDVVSSKTEVVSENQVSVIPTQTLQSGTYLLILKNQTIQKGLKVIIR